MNTYKLQTIDGHYLNEGDTLEGAIQLVNDKFSSINVDIYHDGKLVKAAHYVEPNNRGYEPTEAELEAEELEEELLEDGDWDEDDN